MLKIVIIDDEQLIINHLIKIISSFDLPHQIVGTAENARQALITIRETCYYRYSDGCIKWP